MHRQRLALQARRQRLLLRPLGGPVRLALPQPGGRLLPGALPRPDGGRQPVGEPRQRRFHRGRLIHRLLEILPDVADNQRQRAARDFLAQPAYGLLPNDIDHIVQQITDILTAPDFVEIFSQNSRAEVPIVGLVGRTAISGQVDRLVVLDHEVLIVDYKTNRPPPKDAADIPRIYVRQMAAYRAILSEIYPGKVIKCLLLWTDVARLMVVPDTSLVQIKL